MVTINGNTDSKKMATLMTWANENKTNNQVFVCFKENLLQVILFKTFRYISNITQGYSLMQCQYRESPIMNQR